LKHVIVGTAGHVDHGKTTLIKALTGIDTDRLEEEKRRELSIELGFAPLELPSVGRVGVIDVPGHERFMKNMLAGIGGIDLALLVVAADEGVMPQTRDHLTVLHLLGVSHGVVAMTKTDLVEQEVVELAEEEVHELLAGTTLEGSPIVRVSGVTREGLDDLVSALDSAAAAVEGRRLDMPARLPIDRVFTMKGVGTVVTGTLVSGVIREGDEVELLPEVLKSKARQVQVHGARADEAHAGQRVALNLPGVKREALRRGAVVAAPGYLRPTETIDVRLELLPKVERLKNWTRIRLAIGSAEIIGRLVLLDAEELKGGQVGLAQLRLEAKTTGLRGDRFVLRNYSPLWLIGGGTILDPVAERHKRFDEQVVTALEARGGAELDTAVRESLLLGERTEGELRESLSVSAEELGEAVQRLVDAGEVRRIGAHLVHRQSLDELEKKIGSLLSEFHRRNPLRPGMPKEELRSRMKLRAGAFDEILAQMKTIEVRRDRVALSSFRPTLTARQEEVRRRIEELYRQGKFQPPSRNQVLDPFGEERGVAEEVLFYLLETGELTRVSEDLIFHRDAIAQIREGLGAKLRENGSITVSQVRDLFGSSRKYSVPLLEYFDRIGFTRRVGDERILARKVKGEDRE